MSATRVFSLSRIVCACDCDWGWNCDTGVKDGDIRSSRVGIDDVLTIQREDRRRKVAIVDAAAGRWSSIRLLNSFCCSGELVVIRVQSTYCRLDERLQIGLQIYTRLE